MQRNYLFAGLSLAFLSACMLSGCSTTRWGKPPAPSRGPVPSHVHSISSSPKSDGRRSVTENFLPTILPVQAPLIPWIPPEAATQRAIIAEAPAIRLATHQQSQTSDDKTVIGDDAKKMDGPLVLPKKRPWRRANWARTTCHFHQTTS